MTAVGGIPFGTFTLYRRLARGGMAEVFLARQVGLEGFDRRVAVKRILPHLADSGEFIAMFLREAKLAARLSHPNIVHIYDFGKVGSDYFIAMEFVDGVTASELIARGAKDPMPPALIARLGADAAAALYYAHELRGDNGRRLGIVHRDVSPANVMVSFDGVVKVVDFGIAKAAELTGDRTNPGTVKGKYAYMSPEQTIAAKLDGRSDVFSLSIVLWELVAGRPIVERGDRVAAMRAIRDGRLPRLEQVAPHTPPALVEAISWGLARRREDRPDAAQLAQALESFIKASPELATSMHLSAWVKPRFQSAVEVHASGDGTNVAHTSAEHPGTQASYSDEDLAATIPVERMSAAELFGTHHHTGPMPTRSRPREVATPGVAVEVAAPQPVAPRAAPTRQIAEARMPDPAPHGSPLRTFSVAEQDDYTLFIARRRWIVAAAALAIVVSAFAFTLFVVQPLLARRAARPAPPSPIATPLTPEPGLAPAPVDAGADAGLPVDAGATIDAARSSAAPVAPDAATPVAATLPDAAPEPEPGRAMNATSAARRTSSTKSRLATLTITAVPEDSTIAVDNLPPQRSPAHFSLAAGAHRVRVLREGYVGDRRVIDLTESQRQSLEVVLPRAADVEAMAAPATGRVTVQTNRPAEVFLGTRALGRAPLRGVEVPAGTHTLNFKQQGAPDVRRRVEIKPNETFELSVVLP
ncbi:MAG: protein kinase [Kofleriaceae bacterium]